MECAAAGRGRPRRFDTRARLGSIGRVHDPQDRLSPDYRFDRVETTLSHVLREPHRALGGRAYGPALLDGLDAAGFGPGEAGAVLEIGGGAGWLGAACVAARPGLRWTCLELSRPALCAQRARIGAAGGPARTAFLRGDCRALPLAAGALRGLVLANEVIADLPVAREGDGGLVNRGALDLVGELARVLAPGGRAALVEFGGGGPVEPTPMHGDRGRGDHVEHTIRFPALAEEATSLGLGAQVVRLYDLLGIEGSVRVASYTDLRRLAFLVPSTPMVAVTREELRRRHPLLTRLFSFDLPRLDSPRFPEAHGRVGAAEAFSVLLLRR